MHAPPVWTCRQTLGAQLRRSVRNNWRRRIPGAPRKHILFVRPDEHCGKVAASASLAGRNKLWPAVGSCGGHIVALLLPRPRSATFRRTERCAHRRNHQSQHCQEGNHGGVCRPPANWNRSIHSFIFEGAASLEPSTLISSPWRANLKSESRHQSEASFSSPKSQRRTPFGSFENRPSPAAEATEEAAQSNR
jgi:hypothetical protein